MNVSLSIQDILQISEVDSVLEVSFSLIMDWFDPRLTFTNLNPDPSFNALTEDEKTMIWKPTIEFTNTKYKPTTVTDNDVVATIVKLGEKTLSKESLVYNTYYFVGKENQVSFKRYPFEKIKTINQS